MPRRSGIAMLGAVLAAVTGLVVLPSAHAQAVDKATEAMRREVEAERQKQEAILAKIRAIPAIPAALEPQRAFIQARVAVSDYIYVNIFGSERTDTESRDRLDVLLEVKINEANRQYRITEAERRTLQLAGRGDIKRFFDRVTELREDYEGSVADQIEIRQDKSLLDKIWVLQVKFQSGPFGAGSLFSKALNKIRSGGLAIER